MSDNDLIRRDDALDAAWEADSLELSTHGAGKIEARINAIHAAQPTVSPDIIEINIRAVMMERIEEAASQSPWVPPEYAMNEIISDCCSFLREPRDPSPDVAALVEATFQEGFLAGTADGWVNNPRIEMEWKRSRARAALARVKGVM